MVAQISNKHISLGLILATILVAILMATEALSQSLPPGQQPASAESPRQLSDLGYQYIDKEQYVEAADAFQRAMSADRTSFTLDERVRMAIYISWANRLDAAIDELRLVTEEAPAHVDARIHLARVYSWKGELTNAIREADEALKVSPGNENALLVKADALEWQGRFRRAIPLYREVFERQNRFDAGLGLSWALLSGGNRAAANENARSLVASSGRQQEQLGKLIDEIDDAGRPRVDLRYSEYRDSDDNRAERYSLLHTFGFGNQNFDLGLKRVDAHDAGATNRSEGVAFGVTSNITEGLRLRAAGGLNRLGNDSRNLPSGQFRLDAIVSTIRFGLLADSDVVSDTALLIDNRIRVTSYGSYLSKMWANRLSTSAGYTYKAYSDGNHAHDLQFSPQFALTLAPRLTIGYDLRLLDFASQSGSGFFDPSDYMSNRVSSSFSVEREKIFAYTSIFGGKQRFVRHGERSNEWVVGGSAALGFRPIRQLTIEVNGEGGNFKPESVAGFNYVGLGTRVNVRF